MEYRYQPKGVCAKEFCFQIEDGVITNVEVQGGCPGNLLGIGKLLTGKKLDQKLYRRHSGYISGMKEISYRRLMETKPELVVYEAVRGMLPHNSMGRTMIKKLRVYKGAQHDHAAQKPVAIELVK